MYKIYRSLCTDGLGVSFRQNELIELALTYGFKGIEIDMDDMVGRAEKMGDQFATQFVNAARVEISTFELPINFGASNSEFEAQSSKLDKVCELAESIDAQHCYIKVAPTHPTATYHENFETHRARIAEIADRLAAINTKIGLQFSAATPASDEMQFIHKPDEILALVKAIGHDNVGFILDAWNWQVSGGTFSEAKELDLSEVFEVRLADPPEGFDPSSIDRSKRMEPGSNSQSLCKPMLDWLIESEYPGPVAINAQVPKQPGNTGDILFQRIAKVFDRMLGLEVDEPVVESTEEAEVSTEDEEKDSAESSAESSENKPVASNS